jgi:hypothetical protein
MDFYLPSAGYFSKGENDPQAAEIQERAKGMKFV